MVVGACGLLDPICGFFYPFTVGSAIVLAIIGYATLWLTRAALYHRDLTRDRQGDYWFNMPFIHEKFKATVFKIETQEGVDKLIYAMTHIHEPNKEDQEHLQTLAMADLTRANGYIVRFSDVEGSTRSTGKALILTTGPLEDGAYYAELPAERNLIRGIPTRVRMIRDADRGGFIDDASGVEWNGETLPSIFFPLQPINAPPGYKPVDMEPTKARALISLIAKTDLIIKTGELLASHKTRADAAEEHAYHMEAVAHRLNGELQEEIAERAQKRFDQVGEAAKKVGMNPMVVGIIMIIGTFVFYELFKAVDKAGADDTHLFLGLLMALGLIPALGMLARRMG